MARGNTILARLRSYGVEFHCHLCPQRRDANIVHAHRCRRCGQQPRARFRKNLTRKVLHWARFQDFALVWIVSSLAMFPTFA